ncbi:uncharacterized protein B0J16DRAFT_418236 [Fusarium flagelliforme]|uniref:Uncharacterized protein n=1 Tax=Fusarium flagelliforme TaxID=2675880 RepID=A0A395N347_9HYPO|nr:uncharacterized protein B0J16DRAFT_418236 [Fusarium flagelliforme]KAH7174795.1 hypothetical protein B0J16DRAFT_418236 [Fusarium flagelliforme]RFN54415.1 hypothetical protein FIE12Z_1542 [Fusarium flagelliforme]
MPSEGVLHQSPTLKKMSQKSKSDAESIKTDALLPIRPLHLANIVLREKNHEYRKYRLRDGVCRLWLYETGSGGGSSSITHIAVIPPRTRHKPGEVPTEPYGQGNKDFNAGVKLSTFGYPILELYELVNPVTLNEMKARWGFRVAPQGCQFMKLELWEDRWGEQEDRSEKVKKVF